LKATIQGVGIKIDEQAEISRKSSVVEQEFNVRLKEGGNPITRICITGGPCAGKTTALTEL
jgi:hypothetical protein